MTMYFLKYGSILCMAHLWPKYELLKASESEYQRDVSFVHYNSAYLKGTSCFG